MPQDWQPVVPPPQSTYNELMQGALEARRLAEAAASARRARADRVALVLLVILLLAGCAVGGFYGARYLHD